MEAMRSRIAASRAVSQPGSTCSFCHRRVSPVSSCLASQGSSAPCFCTSSCNLTSADRRASRRARFCASVWAAAWALLRSASASGTRPSRVASSSWASSSWSSPATRSPASCSRRTGSGLCNSRSSCCRRSRRCSSACIWRSASRCVWATRARFCSTRASAARISSRPEAASRTRCSTAGREAWASSALARASSVRAAPVARSSSAWAICSVQCSRWAVHSPICCCNCSRRACRRLRESTTCRISASRRLTWALASYSAPWAVWAASLAA
ncbi:hypothetical protein D9M68_555100 [compost metagenome]